MIGVFVAKPSIALEKLRKEEGRGTDRKTPTILDLNRGGVTPPGG